MNDENLREKLERLIDEARRAYLAYCVEALASPDGDKLTEAAFLADKLIEGGVCFRLEVPRGSVAHRCATCIYETALGSDRCVRCVKHDLWEGRDVGKRN